MKTGRRRKKEQKPEEKTGSAPPSPVPSRRPSPKASSRTPSRTPSRRIILPLILAAALITVVICFIAGRSCLSPRAEPTTYLPATAEGTWTARTQLLVPQVVSSEGWRSDCAADPDCTVLPGSCQVRPREDSFTEQVVDEYDDYAYNIYFEETERNLYEASGGEFVVTQLNESEEWVEEDRHYFAEEWLDEETCQYTEYAVWITDPEDAEYEIEVLLSECEVWDHVIVKQRIYAQEDYCQIEIVDSVAVQDTLARQGVGTNVEWPEASAPTNGRLEQEFEGVVVFRADGTEHQVRVDDLDQYIRYLTVSHYLGVDDEGNVVTVTDRAP